MTLLLLGAGAVVDGPGRDGYLPLHQAARAGHRPILLLLLDRGADPNAAAPGSGVTALMLAANRGFSDSVRSLLAAGADVNARAADGWTALEAAEMIGDEVTLAILHDAMAREKSP